MSVLNENKLTTTLRMRDECREGLLRMRRELSEKRDLVVELGAKARILADGIAKKQKELVELTTEATKLLNADLSGIVGKPSSIPEQIDAELQTA